MSGKARQPKPYALALAPVPPRSWGRREGALWRRITGAFPEGHFRVSDSEDLATYVRAAIEIEELEAVIATEGRVLTDSKTGRLYPHPAAGLRDHAWVRLSAAGTKLRLHLASRMRSESVNTAAKHVAAGRLKPWELDDEGTGKKRNGRNNAGYFDN